MTAVLLQLVTTFLISEKRPFESRQGVFSSFLGVLEPEEQFGVQIWELGGPVWELGGPED